MGNNNSPYGIYPLLVLGPLHLPVSFVHAVRCIDRLVACWREAWHGSVRHVRVRRTQGIAQALSLGDGGREKKKRRGRGY